MIKIFETDYAKNNRDAIRASQACFCATARYGTDQKDTQASDFFDRKFDTYSRGTSGEDFSVVRLQDLPKQVQLPWDYPLVQAPNFSDAEVRFSPQQAPIDDLETKNKIQNKNIWFLNRGIFEFEYIIV